MRHILTPLSASTFTSVLAFVPIATAQGERESLPEPFGVTVIITDQFLISFNGNSRFSPMVRHWKPTTASAAWWQTGFSADRLKQVYH